MRPALLLGLATLGLLACGPAPVTPTEPSAPFQARFAVRGRYAGERLVRWHVEDAPGPLSRAVLAQELEAALETWRALGALEHAPAATAEETTLTVGWRRGAHDACPSFGADPSVAHAGPVGPGSFIHLDAGRAFGPELSLRHALVHELGHVLGLDHSPDEESVMYPEPARVARAPGRSDLAALRTLYGLGATQGAGDLRVLREDGSPALVLAEVAPPELCAWACFDTDGDGDAELLVWRVDADPAAGGALWSYHFGPGPVLERTLGPLYGVSAPGAQLAFAAPTPERRLLALTLGSAPPRILRFDAYGLPGAEEEEPPPGTTFHAPGAGDLDGDGTRETLTRAADGGAR